MKFKELITEDSFRIKLNVAKGNKTMEKVDYKAKDTFEMYGLTFVTHKPSNDIKYYEKGLRDHYAVSEYSTGVSVLRGRGLMKVKKDAKDRLEKAGEEEVLGLIKKHKVINK